MEWKLQVRYFRCSPNQKNKKKTKLDMAWHAYQIGLQNEMSNVFITKSRVEDLKLEEPVDVLISEWMGSFLVIIDRIVFWARC